MTRTKKPNEAQIDNPAQAMAFKGKIMEPVNKIIKKYIDSKITAIQSGKMVTISQFKSYSEANPPPNPYRRINNDDFSFDPVNDTDEDSDAVAV